MQLFTLEKKALLRQLKTSENGLSSALVARRLREFGPNVLERAAEKITCSPIAASTSSFLPSFLRWLLCSPSSPMLIFPARGVICLAMPSLEQ